MRRAPTPAQPAAARDPTWRWLSAIATLTVVASLALGFVLLHERDADRPLLLAPMIGVMQPCILAAGAATALATPNALATPAAPAKPATRAAEGCTGAQGSAADLVEATLSSLGARMSVDGRFELGYTLQIPLLQLFERTPLQAVDDGLAGPSGTGRPTSASRWSIDRDAVRRIVRTLQHNPRPAIVYLFSTHFGIGAPIEAELARDPVNLATTPDGPMAPDRYYTLDIYPWSVATTRNAITQRRAEAIDAVVDELCRLPPADRGKIRGLTLLGEVHQFFPGFESGMGFAPPYRVSDYSEASTTAFRRFLRQRFGRIEALNERLGLAGSAAAYPDFEQIHPPAKDIRREPLARPTEHIDSFAHGKLPISGWVAPAADGRPRTVRIYLDGELLARASTTLSRQDVLAALPTLGSADVGWRHDLDFSQLSPGMHRIDLMLERADSAAPSAPSLMHLGTRLVSIMGRGQQTPAAVPMHALPASQPAGSQARFSIDQPADQSAYWFNPLVPLWHEFRGSQVVRYLDWFDRRVGRSCLWDTPRYIHQIVPFSNPSWDSEKFAVDASLQSVGGVRLGVSLYGEPAYGDSFFDRLAALHEDHFGVTEFHPLAAKTPAALRAMLERQREQGADFVSFFLEPRINGQRLGGPMNIFSFDPANPQFGSDQLWRSVRALMQGAVGP